LMSLPFLEQIAIEKFPNANQNIFPVGLSISAQVLLFVKLKFPDFEAQVS